MNRTERAYDRRSWIYYKVWILLACILLAACAGPGRRVLKPEEQAAFDPTTLRRVALVEPKNFTPPKEASVRIEDPLTGSLIRSLRELDRFEVVPGHLSQPLELVTRVRAWHHGERGATLPTADLQALAASAGADACLVSWIERSSRPVVMNEALEPVPADRYQLELVFVLFDPAGRVYWSLEPRVDRPLEGALGAGVKAAVDEAIGELKRAFTPTSRGPAGIDAPG